jgi:hypothetical protein
MILKISFSLLGKNNDSKDNFMQKKIDLKRLKIKNNLQNQKMLEFPIKIYKNIS